MSQLLRMFFFDRLPPYTGKTDLLRKENTPYTDIQLLWPFFVEEPRDYEKKNSLQKSVKFFWCVGVFSFIGLGKLGRVRKGETCLCCYRALGLAPRFSLYSVTLGFSVFLGGLHAGSNIFFFS